MGFFGVEILHPQHLSGSRNPASIFLGFNRIHVLFGFISLSEVFVVIS